MKIVDVKATPLRIPTSLGAHDFPGNIFRNNDMVIVEVVTDDGLVGIGDAQAWGVIEATTALVEKTLKPLLVGEDPARVSALTRRMFQATHLMGRYGITTFAISGVEIALWDLAGKRAGLPLYDLLGGAVRTEIPAYASLVRYPEEHELIAQQAARAAAEGYTHVKLHQNDPASVRMAREVVGDDVALTVDINCAWGALEATHMALEMSLYDILWLEEPVWPPEDFDALARVQSDSGVNLASGENLCTARQFKAMMDAGAVAFVQPSVIKIGGVAEYLEVCRLAAQYNVEVAPHSPYHGPGWVATLHLIAHTGRGGWIERFYFENEADPIATPLKCERGVYAVPEGPGLGIELDRDVVARYRLDA